LQNFAAQAVIAMENARLITETREALDQQTATAEVLGVINASPGNLAPVFDAMLERAVRLCEADTGHLFRFENGALLRLASRGVAEDFDELFPPESPVPMDPNSVPARMIATRSVVHVHDTREDESFTVYRTRDEVAAVEAGILTVLFVPLIKEGEVVGHFTMHRMEVRPFTDKQIALVQNFAAQAVIAMENARLITETQEALDQQTATAEVLQVINANPGDLQPVFDVILEKAMALCDVAYGDLELYDGATFRAVATRGLTDAFAEQVRRGYPAGEGTGLGLSISYDIVTQQHGGTIAIDSAEDEFTEFTIRLPRQTTGSGASA
jgi:GAF domain-containing protein